jgi:DNA-binding transcriptional LysR family regulator
MTLEQLRIFVAVAERQHMTRAAEALNLTQQAVSAAVVALEETHATALFHRVGRHIELTEAGRLFLDEARSVLSRAAAAELVLSELGGLRRGTLAVQASQTIASYWLPPRLVEFHRAFPDIALKVGIGNTAQVAKAVVDGAAELGFIEGAIDEPALACEPLSEDRMVVVVGATHAWAERDRVEPHELAEAEWVLREVGSGTRSAFESALARLGVAPSALKVVMELPSNEAVRHAVEVGCGVTAISQLVAGSALRANALRRVPIDLPARAFSVVRHRERYRSKAAEALLRAVRDGATPPRRAPRKR